MAAIAKTSPGPVLGVVVPVAGELGEVGAGAGVAGCDCGAGVGVEGVAGAGVAVEP